MNSTIKTMKTRETQLPTTMTHCLGLLAVDSTWCRNSFVDKQYLQQMSMLPYLLFFPFPSVKLLFCNRLSWPSYCALNLTERSSFCQCLSPALSPVHSLSLYPPFPPTHTRSCISSLRLTIEVQGETHRLASGKGVKRGAENKKQVWQRYSLHLNAYHLFFLSD